MDWEYAALGLTLLDVLGRSIDAIPETGEVRIVDEIRMTPAGTAAGPAIVAARLGLRTRLVGSIGDDDLGRVLEGLLRDRGVDLGALQRQAGVRTSATLLTIRSDGERPAFHAPGASLQLERSPSVEDTIRRSSCLHLGGIGTLPRLDGAPLAELLGDCAGDETTVTCDLIAPGPRTRALLAPVLPHVDWFMPTLEEARMLSGEHAVERVAAHFIEAGAGGCIFKVGGEGALLAWQGEITTIPARRVSVVDTTGCGDAFCAGFGAALVRGWSPGRAAHFGSATAATVATGLGSDASLEPFDAIADRFGLQGESQPSAR